MHLKSYLNLYALLENDTSTREERRAFGLVHASIKQKPLAQLSAWTDARSKYLKKPLLSETVSSYLYMVTFVLILFAAVLGFLSGVALLQYNGHEPVNVVYFMAMVIFLPLLTMSMTLFSMIRANRTHSVLVHLTPSYWMEKVLGMFPSNIRESMKNVKINPLLSNWIIIRRSQLIALAFSIGLLLALLAVVATKDIAFSWSTTLHISAETFHAYLSALSLPWRSWVPSAVPSIELIEQSQYFRLGDKLSEQMIQNAAILGEWWKFLAMATLFYAIILRFFVFLLSEIGLKRAIEKSFLTLPQSEKLLREMNEPIISTKAEKSEERFLSAKEHEIQIVKQLNSAYTSIQGWAIDQKNLIVLADSMQIDTTLFFEVGGANSLEEDNEILMQSKGQVLLFVKGWEPPTMDFIDYVDMLSQKVESVVIVPIGTVDEGYNIERSYVDIWARKLSDIKRENVWLKR